MCAVQLVDSFIQSLGISNDQDRTGIVVHIIEVVSAVSGRPEFKAPGYVDFLL